MIKNDYILIIICIKQTFTNIFTSGISLRLVTGFKINESQLNDKRMGKIFIKNIKQ